MLVTIMCNFISWIEYKDNLYYLDNTKLNTKEGRKLLKYLKDNNSMDDICGHGAIRRYYPELKRYGKDIEVEDFSSPSNFPKEIAKRIKKGYFSDIKFDSPPLQLLSDLGVAEYKKIKNPAWAEYEKIKNTAWAEYKKIKNTAWAEYEKIKNPAWAEYEKITNTAWAEYEKIKNTAWAEYEKMKNTAFWGIFKQDKFKHNNWR